MRKVCSVVAFTVMVALVAPYCTNNSRFGLPAPCTNVTAASEDATLLAYVNANNMTGAIKADNNIYYVIDNPGSGLQPNNATTVRVTYRGRLMNNTVFDSSVNVNSPATFAYNSVIPAFQFALSKIRKGGRIRFVTPSSLAYGCSGSGSTIPANSPLFFEVNLIDVF
jgi:FKBP-type peptidyl-prolyl cis-trans isomerase FkpA